MELTPGARSMRTWSLCQICTSGSDSRPYEIVKQPRHAPEEYKPKQGEIDLGTTYKWHLNSCKVQRVAIARPLERQVKKGKLDTVPTYKDFKASA
ncbi:stabilizer of axonemal microtubules 2-like [Kogia breviceps]|uniref:stabilizer of axonemal microtubules 2-like n=1 Tax=Kogia breviceps TaxID=27615 RepID=UPI0027952836|nr:stabilizer of axonemal microtubules 2-like isoform X2 [Kogia breviceps]